MVPSSKPVSAGARVWRGTATETSPMVPPGEPRTSQARECLPARDQGTDARWVPEHLVPGDRDEVRVPATKIQAIGGQEGRGVEQDVPATLVRKVDPAQRVAHAGVIGLRGICEQPGSCGADIAEVVPHDGLVQAQLG